MDEWLRGSASQSCFPGVGGYFHRWLSQPQSPRFPATKSMRASIRTNARMRLLVLELKHLANLPAPSELPVLLLVSEAQEVAAHRPRRIRSRLRNFTFVFAVL